ncbi:hypothetical protein RhiirA5_434065 [Rhizophagus irregularis]|uniref:Uncharacterized protein n=1 Tax=Rhizophagus irregularis TaxID=588596 RepID=A0A2I1EZK9_9GLOM|nr:hypothetical protein RhiirA5_434065 [Rhizophagus irregularis]PKC64787.1 hypothetical protein RhiirA1_461945 [Rhizophagus irregularis]PKY27559.1 hypothetical protein RhiirB3_443327 [Rhizophagus irregularis]
MDNEQQPTNQERAPTENPRDNLNTSSCDFSDTTSNNPSSYASFAIRRRRTQRHHLSPKESNRLLIISQNLYMAKFE